METLGKAANENSKTVLRTLESHLSAALRDGPRERTKLAIEAAYVLDRTLGSEAYEGVSDRILDSCRDEITSISGDYFELLLLRLFRGEDLLDELVERYTLGSLVREYRNPFLGRTIFYCPAAFLMAGLSGNFPHGSRDHRVRSLRRLGRILLTLEPPWFQLDEVSNHRILPFHLSEGVEQLSDQDAMFATAVLFALHAEIQGRLGVDSDPNMNSEGHVSKTLLAIARNDLANLAPEDIDRTLAHLALDRSQESLLRSWARGQVRFATWQDD